MGERDLPKITEEKDKEVEQAPQFVKVQQDYKRVQNYPLIRYSDMPDEIQQDATDVCVCACEKFPNNKEAASKDVKEQMDARYGRGWSVVIGEGFSFEITYTVQNILYIFFGDVAVCVWRCI